MRTRLLASLVFVMTMAASSWSASCAEQTNKTERLTVHGRLARYNGTPPSRIWIVGTKRVSGVWGSPKELSDLMSWDREIFADFIVEPLTTYEKGVMQKVRVISASKIVVTEKEKIVLRKDKL
jgi:hypothetical protein